ncbi:hypothetical protein IYR97_08010 [Pseudomonas fulva]|uniref:Uncharacterized protein n=1 Tax=Pseudomonas fulva TaxID=47880 RepID=A0A7S9Q9C3_9PSED|nr:hypothetical protein [Pseudomonas fulva]QPH45548.1 hypothetical protein IYR97_08010 [Pseudomonas fulva]QPH50633.1 hypothetical protein IZU98_08025 [Pseudomonas fulva]
MQEVFFTAAIIIAIGYLSSMVTGFIVVATFKSFLTFKGAMFLTGIMLVTFWIVPVITAVVSIQSLLLCYKISGAVYAIGVIAYIGYAAKVSPSL